MKRKLAMVAVLAVMVCGSSTSAFAGFNLGVSIGEGFSVYKKKVTRTPFNLEVTPNYKLSIVHFDLGLVADLDKLVNFTFRPGIRIQVPFVFFRVAMPLRVTHGFNYGFMLGVGATLFSLKIVRFYLEADTFFSKKGEWFSSVPVEFRFGVEFGF